MPQDLILDLLLVLNMIVCVLLIGVVLLQRSEGGAFGTGGPTGLVTARGAGDLLTRTTWILFSLFLGLSLALTLLGGHERSSQGFLNSLKNTTINPDAVAHQPPPTTAPSTALPGAAQPAPSQNPSLALPPVAGAAPATAPATTHKAAGHPAQKAPPIISAPPPTAPAQTAPPSLALPPIGGSTSPPTH